MPDQLEQEFAVEIADLFLAPSEEEIERVRVKLIAYRTAFLVGLNVPVAQS